MRHWSILLLLAGCGGGALPGMSNAVGDPTFPTETNSEPATREEPGPAWVANGTQDEGETDVDCGGVFAPLCSDGMQCLAASDCASDNCNSDSRCSTPSYTDGEKNGDETDVDCGGSERLQFPCANGGSCLTDGDCASALCSDELTCLEPACRDAVRNGGETDIDCGGGACERCAGGRTCEGGSDCASGECANGRCTEPSFEWVVQSVSMACSATCGSGTRNRTVACRRNDGTFVEPSNCDARSIPAATESCESSLSCGYRFVSAQGWGTCSVGCGVDGAQSRAVECYDRVSGSQVEAEFCESVDFELEGSLDSDALASVRGCEDHSACEVVGDFAEECQVSAANSELACVDTTGVQLRSVSCRDSRRNVELGTLAECESAGLDVSTSRSCSGGNLCGRLAPASYAFSMRWREGGQMQARTGAYTFRADGTFRADFWQWSENEALTYSAVRQIGETEPGSPSDDAANSVISEYGFARENSDIEVAVGSYEIYGNGMFVQITWPNGDTENWRRTWHDGRLTKLECFYSTQADGIRDFYLLNDVPGTRSFTRDANATNAGFAFGSPYGFNASGLPISNFDDSYVGLVSRWESTNYEMLGHDTRDGVQAQSLAVAEDFEYATVPQIADGTLRYVNSQTAPALDVYHYLARPIANPGMTSRRVVMQVSNDFNRDGSIQGDVGHTYYGMQVIDHAGAPRGFVFAEATWRPARSAMNSMAALFYIDVVDEAAQTGIEAEP